MSNTVSVVGYSPPNYGYAGPFYQTLTNPYTGATGEYEIRISPEGSRYATAIVGENYPTWVPKPSMTLAPTFESRKIGRSLIPVGGRSVMVKSPPATVIPGYTYGEPAWGGSNIPTYRPSIYTISEEMNNQNIQAAAAARAQEEMYRQTIQAQAEAEQYEQVRAQTLSSLGVKPKGERKHYKAQEKYIINAFDNFPGTLQEKISQAVNARNKLDYFKSIGVGNDDPEKGELSGRMVKQTDIEWPIWEKYDEGGPLAAETVRKTIIAAAKTTGGRSKNIQGSVLRAVMQKPTAAGSQKVTKGGVKVRSKSPVRDTKAASVRSLGPVSKPMGKTTVRARSKSPSIDLRKMTTREIATYNRKIKKAEKAAKEAEEEIYDEGDTYGNKGGY